MSCAQEVSAADQAAQAVQAAQDERANQAVLVEQAQQKPPVKTTLCYLERDGRYLMLLRNKKKQDANKGKWIGVGGKLEPGETPEECLVREVREETGFELAGFRFRGVVEFVSDTWDDETMYLFTSEEFTWDAEAVRLEDGLPVPECPEGTLAWIPKDEVLELNLWEGDRAFLQCLIEDAPDASMTLRYEGDDLVSIQRAAG